MFDSNILTFNPGWVGLGQPVEGFTDVRVLIDQLRSVGIECVADTTNDARSGPASFQVTDPDGKRDPLRPTRLIADTNGCEAAPGAILGGPRRAVS